MAVTLLKNVGSYLSGAVVAFDDATEATLIAQRLATAANATSAVCIAGAPFMLMTQGGNVAVVPQSGVGTPTYDQGPRNLPCINLGSAALTGYETNGVAQVAGTMNLTEIYVPYTQTWTGIGVLNGTTVGTDNLLVALYGANGALLANSAVAGVLSAGASVFQNVAFTTPITTIPGRYFLGCQFSGATATPRHLLAANGSNVCTGTQAGTFGTVPATLTTIPVTFTTAVGTITQLYR